MTGAEPTSLDGERERGIAAFENQLQIVILRTVDDRPEGPFLPLEPEQAAAVELFAAGRFAEREPAGEGFQGEVGRFRRQVGAYQPEIVFVVTVLPAVVLEIVVPDSFDERELPCVQIEPGELDRRLPLRAAGLGRVGSASRFR